MHREILRKTFGYNSFRGGQESIIKAILANKDTLGVMPTGAGKSICYQIPALMLPGITLVISPLISLMKDQVGALKQAGVPAAYINSSLTAAQSKEALRRAAAKWYKIIYVAPERLESPDFLYFAMQASIDMVTVDEAHCVSQWGQDFRPSYLRIPTFIQKLPKRPRLSAFTATATSQVREDIIHLLNLQDPFTTITGFDRPNLFFGVSEPKDKKKALIALLKQRNGQAGIIYCSTRKQVDEVASTLIDLGIPATQYHAGMPEEARRVNQDDFQYDRKTVMVATNAFGMGIDKSNVSFVIHFNMPKNLESYYQEAGRAGRDGSPADCILLYSAKDVNTARWMIEHGEVNEALTPVEQIAIHTKDLERLKDMILYCKTKSCLRQSILRYFGETAPSHCGYCSICLETQSLQSSAENAPPKVDITFHKKEALLIPSTTDESWRSVKKRRRAQPPTTGAIDQDLLAQLKALRMKLANAQDVPAYFIFSDSTLRDMARLRPKTEQALFRINGVGTRKMEKYGEAFLCILKGDPHPDISDIIKKINEEKTTEREYKQKPFMDRANQPWDNGEDAQLHDEILRGFTIEEISQVHNRTRGAILSRLRKLGIE